MRGHEAEGGLRGRLRRALLQDETNPGASAGSCHLPDLDDPVHVERVNRYVDYALARMAAHRNEFYALVSECANIYPDLVDVLDAWYAHWAEEVASHDPHGRLCSFGDTGERILLKLNARNAILITQEHTPLTDIEQFAMFLNDLAEGFGECFWAHGRPVVVGEQDLILSRKVIRIPLE